MWYLTGVLYLVALLVLYFLVERWVASRHFGKRLNDPVLGELM